MSASIIFWTSPIIPKEADLASGVRGDADLGSPVLPLDGSRSLLHSKVGQRTDGQGILGVEDGHLLELIQCLPVLLTKLHDQIDFPLFGLQSADGACRQSVVDRHGHCLSGEPCRQSSLAVHLDVDLFVPTLEGGVHVFDERNLLRAVNDFLGDELQNREIVTTDIHTDAHHPAAVPPHALGEPKFDSGLDGQQARIVSRISRVLSLLSSSSVRMTSKRLRPLPNRHRERPLPRCNGSYIGNLQLFFLRHQKLEELFMKAAFCSSE